MAETDHRIARVLEARGRRIITFDDADPLRLAFDRSPVRVPWWRVYQVLRSDAALVYEETGEARQTTSR